MNISFKGIGDQYVTFAAAETADLGAVCKISANGTVDKCAADDAFCGVIAELRFGMAGVRMGGYVELPYTGTAPALGYTALAADGEGGVKVPEKGGQPYLVISVDTETQTVGLFL